MGHSEVVRKIIHIDMDAFYASVEQRDFIEYRGAPLVVGGRPDSRGVVATASYEARKYGIRSAMPCSQAYRLCPHAIFVPPRFEVYKRVSHQIRQIFSRYTDIIEPLSLDEAFLDVTNDKLDIGSAMEIAQQIKSAIRDELRLTASAGVSINKFVAKIASDMDKPDGLTFVGPSKIEAFMEKLPVEKFFGVGKVTASKMKQLQIYTGADLKRYAEADLVRLFGKSGRFFYRVVRGIDPRPVQPHREVKSLAVEDTFSTDLYAFDAMALELARIGEQLWGRMSQRALLPKTLTVKVKYTDFSQKTRSVSRQEGYLDRESILSAGEQLLQQAMQDDSRGVRLLGLSASNFKHPRLESRQLRLFDE